MKAVSNVFLVGGILLLAGGTARATTDLSVSNPSTWNSGPFTYVSFDVGIQIDETESDYLVGAAVTRTRNGVTSTLYLDLEAITFGPILGKTNCSTCVSSCSGSCKYKHDGVEITGACEDNGSCSGSTKHCICSGTTPKTIFFSSGTFQSGDVVTITITPEDGVTETNTSNNSVSFNF